MTGTVARWAGAVGMAMAWLAAVGPARAEVLCTVIADVRTSAIVHEAGDCTTRVTPASTFKIPLALMAFDVGVLTDTDAPVLPFRPGYPNWGGDNWRQDTDPRRWMRYSVLWYSRQITPRLGRALLERYSARFGYGNADFAGDPGRDNGLERAWIASSLRISPREQVAFLGRLLRSELGVSPRARLKTIEIVERFRVGSGWMMKGKTGAAFPRLDTGRLDYSRGWGWFVGWAEREGQVYAFARLAQDRKRQPGSPGIRARDRLIADWQTLAEAIDR